MWRREHEGDDGQVIVIGFMLGHGQLSWAAVERRIGVALCVGLGRRDGRLLGDHLQLCHHATVPPCGLAISVLWLQATSRLL